MKDFTQCKINSHQLEFLTGQTMPCGVYEKLLSKTQYDTLTDRQLNNYPFLVADVIKTKLLKPTSSTDPRYDKQEPIMFAVKTLRDKGLSKEMRGAILSDKFCVKKQRLSAHYFILNEVLTGVQLDELYAQLKAKLEYHTTPMDDLMGGTLPEFINFSPKTIIGSGITQAERRKGV